MKVLDPWNRQEEVISTPRLHLHHISAANLITLFRDPENPIIYHNMPYTNPHRILVDEKGPLPWRVPQVEVDPKVNEWFIRWIVLKESQEIIGSTSFHGAPNLEGMIEIGLEIHGDFRRKGFARESLIGFWHWALKNPAVKILRYTVSPKNLPSMQLIQSLGFALVGEQIDEEEGLEYIYEMSSVKYCEMYSLGNARTGE